MTIINEVELMILCTSFGERENNRENECGLK